MHGNHKSTILIVEDEYFISEEIIRVVRNNGATVVGPASTLQEARDLDSDGAVDAALLDINIRGDMSFDFARDLQASGRPFAFLSGYGRDALPKEFEDVPLVTKPYSQEQLDRLCRWVLNRVPAETGSRGEIAGTSALGA
jgi:two-component SAPR family response regulator